MIGASKLSEKDVIGTWKYYQPGCAFTSENALATAGGKVVAAQAKEKLQPTYDKLKISGKNTYFTFNQDGTFSAKVMGKTINGTYTFNSSNSSVQLQTLLLSTTGYLTRNPQGISLLFERSCPEVHEPDISERSHDDEHHDALDQAARYFFDNQEYDHHNGDGEKIKVEILTHEYVIHLLVT